MTEGYHANDKKTSQGAANVEVILFNHLMQERWKGANRAMERILFPLEWKTKGSTTKGLLP
jgi:hypothetical protein